MSHRLYIIRETVTGYNTYNSDLPWDSQREGRHCTCEKWGALSTVQYLVKLRETTRIVWGSPVCWVLTAESQEYFKSAWWWWWWWYCPETLFHHLTPPTNRQHNSDNNLQSFRPADLLHFDTLDPSPTSTPTNLSIITTFNKVWSIDTGHYILHTLQPAPSRN